MTTLTAADEVLPDHCPHKLATSCRLTARPICCACQDKRPHSAFYSTYVDGVGFVLRGRRQQKYCWQCMVFWDKRIQDSGVEQEDTRIPDVPDQTSFLQRWHEWHQGWRLIRNVDGSEERTILSGEPLASVDLGCLPRTTEDMNLNLRVSSEQTAIGNAQQREEIRRLRREEQQQRTQTTIAIPEDERLFDDSESHRDTYRPPAEPPIELAIANILIDDRLRNHLVYGLKISAGASLSPQLAADQRQRQTFSSFESNPRLDNFIDTILPELYENLREDLLEHYRGARLNGSRDYPRTANTPSTRETSTLATQSSEAGVTSLPLPLNNAYIRSLSLSTTQALVRQYTADLEHLRRRQQQLAPLGTREDVEDPEYVSPITNMFSNFQSQHLQRQAVRRRQQEALRERLDRDAEWFLEAVRQREQSRSEEWTRRIQQRLLPSDSQGSGVSTSTTADQNERSSGTPPGYASSHLHQSTLPSQLSPLISPKMSLDNPSDNRPAPLNDNEMVVKLQCCICISQLAQIAVLPCGHLAMCKWCQSSWIPSRPIEPTVPARGDYRCPVCRTKVKKLCRIYGADERTIGQDAGIGKENASAPVKPTKTGSLGNETVGQNAEVVVAEANQTSVSELAEGMVALENASAIPDADESAVNEARGG